jgi:hypothetical protein
MSKRPRIFTLCVLAACVAAVLGSANLANACPTCQQALAGDLSQGDLARGIYYSVLFMMAMPFAIVGTFATFAYRAVKREQRRLAEQNQQHRDPPAR